jgi:hypothetical protein
MIIHAIFSYLFAEIAVASAVMFGRPWRAAIAQACPSPGRGAYPQA